MRGKSFSPQHICPKLCVQSDVHGARLAVPQQTAIARLRKDLPGRITLAARDSSSLPVQDLLSAHSVVA